MEKQVRFFKQEGKWYADVPNHTLEENEMVMGADVALDFISKGSDEVVLTLSDSKEESNPLLTLHLIDHDDEGGYYEPYGFLYNRFMDEFDFSIEGFSNSIWICNVTHDVFGEHPEYINVVKINNASLV